MIVWDVDKESEKTSRNDDTQAKSTKEVRRIQGLQKTTNQTPTGCMTSIKVKIARENDPSEVGMQETTLLGAKIVVQLMLYNRCRAADVVQSKTYNQCRTIDDHPRAQDRTLFLSLILSIGLFFRGISRSDFRILGNSFFLHSSPSLRPLLAHNNYASTNITRTC